MTLSRIIFVTIWAHWFADFVLQTDAQARGKSSSNWKLAQHIAVYHCTLLLFVWWGHSFREACVYATVNSLTHFAIDWVTSRITKRLWAKQRVHDFFVVIGIDQALHMTVLMATLPILGGAPMTLDLTKLRELASKANEPASTIVNPTEKNKLFREAFNPETALALLDRIDEWKEMYFRRDDESVRLRAENAKLHSKLEELTNENWRLKQW